MSLLAFKVCCNIYYGFKMVSDILFKVFCFTALLTYNLKQTNQMKNNMNSEFRLMNI